MRMRSVRHLAYIGEMRNAHKILVGKLEGNKKLSVDKRIILEWILGK
jgi:hypothetical protein